MYPKDPNELPHVYAHLARMCERPMAVYNVEDELNLRGSFPLKIATQNGRAESECCDEFG